MLPLITSHGIHLSAPWASIRISDWTYYHRTPSCQLCFHNYDILPEVPLFPAGYSRGVRCRRFTICLMYGIPFFGNLVLYNNPSLCLTQRERFFIFCSVNTYTYIYLAPSLKITVFFICLIWRFKYPCTPFPLDIALGHSILLTLGVENPQVVDWKRKGPLTIVSVFVVVSPDTLCIEWPSCVSKDQCVG